MKDVVLVTGSETLTGRKLIEKLLTKGSQVVVPVAGKVTDIKDTNTPNLTVLSWNRSSWFSTKNVVREVLRRFGRIDSAWVLHQPIASVDVFADSGSSDIEEVLEHSVKGNVAIIRELYAPVNSSKGFLAAVIPHRAGGSTSPLEALSTGAFSSFSTSLFQEVNDAIWMCGFKSSSPDAEGFIENMIRMQEEKPEKLRNQWFKYAEGRRIFGGSAIVKTLC